MDICGIALRVIRGPLTIIGATIATTPCGDTLRKLTMMCLILSYGEMQVKFTCSPGVYSESRCSLKL